MSGLTQWINTHIKSVSTSLRSLHSTFVGVMRDRTIKKSDLHSNTEHEIHLKQPQILQHRKVSSEIFISDVTHCLLILLYLVGEQSSLRSALAYVCIYIKICLHIYKD